MKTFKEICQEVDEGYTVFYEDGGGKAPSGVTLNVAAKIYAAECAKNSAVKPLSEAEIKAAISNELDIKLKGFETAVKAGEVAMLSLLKSQRDKVTPLLAEQLWDIYAKAVGGKTFDGKPLPKFSKLGTQQTGWFEVANAVNAKLGFKLSKSETAPISAKPKPEPVED